MKLSLRWLGRYVDLDDCTAEQVREELTLSTAEVEGVTAFGSGLEDVVVGHVLRSQRHPQADKLTVNAVDVGEGAPLEVVCGAPNVAAGQRVAVVRPGGTLPGGVKIKKAVIRGVESRGMICSERELGLSDEHGGILVLPGTPAPGTRLVDAFAVRDDVLEIDNKSINHRPDLWGHYGFARELAAILGRPLRPLDIAGELPAAGRALGIAIEDPADCPRYTGLVFEGVSAARSPDWLRWLLAAVGQRCLSAVVDATNFVMLEVGQPMHAFDLRRLPPGDIGVRGARPGESITTIDGVARALQPGDLLITAGDVPVALAGIMGGAASAVADDTTELFLESATFHAARIRRTSARLALRTEASARFEKSLDPAAAELASRRFARLLAELCPGARPAGPLVDPAAWRYRPRVVALRRARLAAKLGVEVADERVASILRGLQFGVAPAAGGWDVAVPSFRATKDIEIEDDLIEEVGRMFRYGNIPEQPLRSTVEVPPREPGLYLAREVLRIGATELGCSEVYNYSFVPDAVLAAVGALDSEYARVRNPVAPDAARIRRHVLPSLLASVALNLRDRARVWLMEHGKGYHPEHRDEHGLPREVEEIAFACSHREGAPHPYPALRGHLELLLRRVGHPAVLGERYRAGGLPWVHPGRTAAISRGGAAVGYVGWLHPRAARGLGLPPSTAIACLDLRALVASGREVTAFAPIPRFPSQPVDVALAVPEPFTVGAAAALLRAVGKALVRRVELFEVYRGAGLPAGHKSLNFTVTLGADDRTLTAADEERYLSAVRRRVAEVGGELRG